MSDFEMAGTIADRWRAWGGADGAFGQPLGPAEEVPGLTGQRQRFERGEIGWSPDQEMVVSVYRLRNEACFEWSKTSFNYDYFRYEILYNGAAQGRLDVEYNGPEQIWTRLQGFGEYEFTVEGVKESLFGERSDQGLTIPVRLLLDASHETPTPHPEPEAHVFDIISERWHELGAWDGPLGKSLLCSISTSSRRTILSEPRRRSCWTMRA